MPHAFQERIPRAEVDSCELFRVTRNANTERNEDQADDLLALIESELRERRLAPIVRLEVARSMDPSHLGMLASELGLDPGLDVFEVDGMLATRDLMHELRAAGAVQGGPPSPGPADRRRFSDALDRLLTRLTARA